MFSPDELAGIVDTFGALDREELERACSETAFRRGEPLEDDEVEADLEAALAADALVEHDGRFVVGPAAFPALPEGAEDLPHIMDVGRRSVDREAVAAAVGDAIAAEVEAAVADADRERCRALLDRCYEVEAWGPVDLGAERDRLESVLDDGDE